VGHHVTNLVTEEERANPSLTGKALNNKPSPKPNQPRLVRLPTSSTDGTNRAPSREQDNGPSSDDQTIRSLLMGKLCKWALALIRHKVGTDGAVDEHMAQALATWLHRRGISIYMEREL
jgi:hypothetical protein